jgi:hypothetical protein
MKRCSKCRESFPTEMFYKNRNHKDGLHSRCKRCDRKSTMKKPDADEAIFSGPLGEMTKRLDPYTEGDPMGVHMTLIAAFSAKLGKYTRVQTGKGLSSLSIWPVLVGHTGVGRKGTATDHAMKVVAKAFPSFADKVLYTVPATGLGFMQVVEEHVQDGSMHPLLAIEEEMDAFISNAKKDTRIGTVLRKAWDGSDLRHRTSKDDIKVTDVHLAIVGHVQPKNWGAISGSKDATGGTYNRFLPIAVERSKVIPVFSTEDTSELVGELAKGFRMMTVFAMDVPVVSVSPDVAKVFEEKHRPACEALTAGNEDLAQMSERAMAYMVRLAAIYALADRRDTIAERDFDAALSIVKYSVETVAAVIPEVGGDRLVTKIAQFVKEHGPVTKTEVRVHVGKHVETAEVDRALLALPQIQKTKAAPNGKLGRRPEMLSWVEKAEDDNVPVAANERK